MPSSRLKARASVRIGISGWRYPPWRGVFYPKDLAQKRELEYASRQVSTIEINGSFYSLQKPSSYRHWYAQTPEDFIFSVKGPRFITHMRRLVNVQSPLGNFFGSGVLHLREKLGPFLWQLPPNFLFDEDKLSGFFQQLPRTVAEAARLTDSADRLTPDLPPGARQSDRPLRHALEIRHHSFENPDFIELLAKHRVCLVFADTAGTWPYMEDLTSDFVYIRLHGEKELYRSGYDDLSLRIWARRLRQWMAGRQVTNPLTLVDRHVPVKPRDAFVYFDNDIKVHAPFDARRLQKLLKQRD